MWRGTCFHVGSDLYHDIAEADDCCEYRQQVTTDRRLPTRVTHPAATPRPAAVVPLTMGHARPSAVPTALTMPRSAAPRPWTASAASVSAPPSAGTQRLARPCCSPIGVSVL